MSQTTFVTSKFSNQYKKIRDTEAKLKVILDKSEYFCEPASAMLKRPKTGLDLKVRETSHS